MLSTLSTITRRTSANKIIMAHFREARGAATAGVVTKPNISDFTLPFYHGRRSSSDEWIPDLEVDCTDGSLLNSQDLGAVEPSSTFWLDGMRAEIKPITGNPKEDDVLYTPPNLETDMENLDIPSGGSDVVCEQPMGLESLASQEKMQSEDSGYETMHIPAATSLYKPMDVSDEARGAGASERDEQEESASLTTCLPAVKVKEKGRPLKAQVPPADHQPLSAEEVSNAERAAQKEKLHAELKQVLQLKGQNQRWSLQHSDAATMDPRPSASEEEVKKAEMVQIVMETEAEAGVSGICITGGGRSGLFIRNVLKDSPAAKSLSLQEGDQLLSAKVYFDNVKYEDALRILQSAEPYKISFCLKRNVQSADVSMSPGTGTFEVKGPKAKMPKMTVKSLTPIKKTKTPVKVSSESSLEQGEEGDAKISVGQLDIEPVSVEFSLPRFGKFKKSKATDAAGGSPDLSVKRSSADTKMMKLKLPRMRVKEAAGMEGLALEAHGTGGKNGGKLPLEKVDTKGVDAEGKVKAKSPRFGISLSKSKKSPAPKPDSGGKEDIKLKAPQVELDISLPAGKTNIDAEGTEVSGKGEGFKMKTPAYGLSSKLPDVEIKSFLSEPKGGVDAERPDGSLLIHAIPKIGISLPGGDGESERSSMIREGRQEIHKIEMKLPSVEIAAPAVDVDLSLPKVDGRVDMGDIVSIDINAKGEGFQVQKPNFGASAIVPQVDLALPQSRMASDIKEGTLEGKLKMADLKAPKVGISFPKGKVESEMGIVIPKPKLESDVPDGTGHTGIRLPSLDISAPKLDVDINLPKEKEEVDYSIDPGLPNELTIEIPDLTIKMPKVTLPEFGGLGKESDFSTQLDSPKLKADVKPSKAGAVEVESLDIKAKGQKMKLPNFGFSFGKEKHGISDPRVEIKTKEPEVAAEGNLQLPAMKMPSIDISAPQVPIVELPKTKTEIFGLPVEGEIKLHDLQHLEGHDSKFKMPTVSLPKFDNAAEPKIDIHVSPPKIGAGVKMSKEEVDSKYSELEIHADKISIPKVDISIPKLKLMDAQVAPLKADLSTEKPQTIGKSLEVDFHLKSHEFKTGSSESKISFPSVKMPSFNIDIPKVDLGIDLSSDITEHSAEDVDGNWKIPKVSLPSIHGQEKDFQTGASSPKFQLDTKAPHIDVDVVGAGLIEKTGGITMPKVGISLGGGKLVKEGGIELKGLQFKGTVPAHIETQEMLETNVKLPSVKMPSLELSTPKIPDVDIDVGIPKVSLGTSERDNAELDMSGEEDAKLKSPKFSLPKFGMSGSKTKKGEVHIKGPEAELGTDSADAPAKGLWLKMPKFGLSFPKMKLDSESLTDSSQHKIMADIKAPKAKMDITESAKELDSTEARIKLPTVKLPKVDLSGPNIGIDLSLPKSKSNAHRKEYTEFSNTGDFRDPEISIEVPEVQLEMPKFELPKLGGGSKKGIDISLDSSKAAPKVKKEVYAEVLAGSVELNVTDGKLKGKEGKIKMPKFKMPSFHMSKKEADVSGGKVEGSVTTPEMNVKVKKGKAEVHKVEPEIESPEAKGKISFMKMPTFKMTSPKNKALGEDIKSKAAMHSGGSLEELQGTDLHLKMPKISLPKLGGKEGKATDGAALIVDEAKEGGSAEIHMKQSKLKMPSLEISAPSVKSGIEISTFKAVVDSGAEDLVQNKGDLKMPSLNVSAPRLELDFSIPKAKVGNVLEHEGKDKMSLQKSDVKMQIPKVGLPAFDLAVLRGREADTEIKGIDTEFHLLAGKMKQAPTLALKDQKVRLEGEGPEGALEVENAILKGSKVRMPTLDISLPKIRTSDADIPFADDTVDADGYGATDDSDEAMITVPSVEFPKIPSPHIKAPELELDISLHKREDIAQESALGKTGYHIKVPDVELSASDVEGTDLKFKMPKIKMPKFRSSSVEGKDEEGDHSEAGIKGVKIKMPKLQLGSLKGKAEESEMPTERDVKTKGVSTEMKMHDGEAHGGNFKFKVPTVGLSMGGTGTKEQDTDMEPLHPTKEEGELHIRMPKVSLPDVGFTESEGVVNAKLKAPKAQSPKSSGIGDLEIDLGLSEAKMKLPHVKVPLIGISGWKGKSEDDMNVSLGSKADFRAEEQEGKKLNFRMPDVEFSSPKIKAHAEYDVGGAMVEQATSKDKGDTAAPIKISGKVKGSKNDITQSTSMEEEDDSGKLFQVKLPSFGISLPKFGLDGEMETKKADLQSHGDLCFKPGSAENENEKQEEKVNMPKVKKAVFVFVKSKEKGADASSGLLESDVDSKPGTLEIGTPSSDLTIKLPKIKKKPSFGRSRTKQKGVAVNGDFDTSARGESNVKTIKLKFPKLGFSSSKTDSLEVNGSTPSDPSHQLNGDHELSLENGSHESKLKHGKLKIPKLQFSSPYKGKEQDSDMNLKLVKTEDPQTKDETPGSAFAVLKAAKFKPPKMSFSGFKKKADKDEDTDGSANIVFSSARTEMASMEKEGEGEAKTGKGKISLGFFSSKSRGEYIIDKSGGTSHSENRQVARHEDIDGEDKEKAAGFRLPKVSLSTKSHEVEDITEHSAHEKSAYFQETGGEDGSSGFKITLPQVGFKAYEQHTSEERIITDEGGSILRVTHTRHVETEPEVSTII